MRKKIVSILVIILFVFTIIVTMLFLRGLYSASIVFIAFYLLIVQSIICYKNQKHFNQFTMSLSFCVILFYMIFLVSAAASVGTEQMSTGHIVPLSEFVNTDGTI